MLNYCQFSQKLPLYDLRHLIKNHFYGKKVTIAGYYPSNYEVDILKFLEEASKKNFKIALPVIKTKTSMNFKLWPFMDPLYVNNFGILEPKNSD